MFLCLRRHEMSFFTAAFRRNLIFLQFKACLSTKVKWRSFAFPWTLVCLSDFNWDASHDISITRMDGHKWLLTNVQWRTAGSTLKSCLGVTLTLTGCPVGSANWFVSNIPNANGLVFPITTFFTIINLIFSWVWVWVNLNNLVLNCQKSNGEPVSF